MWIKGLVKWLGLLVGLPTVAIAAFFFWASANTFPKDEYAAIVTYDSDSAALAPSKETFTIATYNIGYLSGLENNTGTLLERSLFEANQARALAALQSIQPDIIGFQEIDFNAKRSYEVNQMDAFATGLGMGSGAVAINWDKNYLPFPYWPPAANFGKILSGQAILSRYPIEKNSRIVLERVTGKPFFYNAFYLDRLAQVSQIRLGNQPIIIISVHLEAFVEQTRVNQTKFVRQLAEDYAKTYPVIVIGDFNSALNRPTFVSAQGDTYSEAQFSIKEMLASQQLTPAVPPSDWNGENATFPADSPEYKLDYFFYTPSTIEVLETQVVTSAAQSSDHLPLMMRFKLK